MKNIVKKLLVSLMVLAMVVYAGVAVFANQAPVEAETIDFTASEINNAYDISEKVAFPLSVDVEYKGETKTASDGIVIYPSGKIVKITETAISFTELGEYKLRYFFKDGSATVTAEKTFKVSSDLYYLTSESGSITPVTAEMNAASDYTYLSDNTMPTEREGLILRLSEGCGFKYNKPINLTDADEYGFADIISIDPRLLNTTGINNTVYTYDKTIASIVKIKLVDCYDPNIFMEIILEASGATVYARVGTNHQTNGGIYYPNSAATSAKIKEYYVGGLRGVCRLDHGGQWGHSFGLNSRGYNEKPAGALNFYYDYENHRIYAAGGSRTREDAVIVNDLTSEAIYGTNLFQGFTTGEVFMSLECSSYNYAEEARINILAVGNDQGDYLVQSYKGDESYLAYEDEVAPAIKLTDVTVDKVYCEKGDTFTIPNAVAYDVNLIGGVETRVYRNYDSANKASVSIVDGKFAVNAVDTYYIEYSAVDKYGNRGVKIFKVYGVDNEGVDKSLAVKTEHLTTMDAGALITLPAFTVSTVNDPASVKLDIVAKSAKETINIASFAGLDAINEASQFGIKFTPKYAGEYTISYILKDSVYDQSNDPYSYTVNCVASNVVSFLDTPFLERYLIKNATYGLKEFTAFEFTQGEPTAKKVEAYISFDGGEFTKINDIQKILITGSETAQVKYAVNEDNYILSDIVKIVDAEYGDYTIKMNKYFQYEDGAFTVEELDEDGWELTDILYKSVPKEGTNKLSFVNSLFYNNFTFQYQIAKGLDNMDSISIILTDVKDPSYTTKVTIGKKNAASYVTINDGMQYDYAMPFADSQHTIAYKKDVRKFVIGKTVINYDIEFPSGRAYLDVVFNNIYGETGILVKTVNNQKMLGDSHDDTNVPQINVKRTSGNFNVGDVVTIYAPDYADILSPIDLSTIKYSVYYGDVFMKSVDGTLLDGTNDPFKDVQIKLDALGEYSVVYSAKDIYGQQASGRYYLSAVDTIDPTITVDGYQEGYIYNVKLGQKITISYQVSDNVTPDEECRVGITVTNMKTYSNSYWNRSDQEEGFELGECSFFIIEEGLHRVDILCRDAAGNYVYKSYQFMVKA